MLVNFTNSEEFIYVFRQGRSVKNARFFKVGFAKGDASNNYKNLGARWTNLQTGNPFELNLHCNTNFDKFNGFWKVRDMKKAETKAHKALDDNLFFKRARELPNNDGGGSEWFMNDKAGRCPCSYVESAIENLIV